MFKKIFLFIVIALISLQAIYAEDITVSFPKTVTLVNTPVNVDLYIYNSTNNTQTFTLTPYTAPHPSSFSETRFSLSPNSSKKIRLIITPLTDVLESTYSSSIEVKSINYYKKINFEIIQKSNRACSVDLQYFVQYVKESGNYKLELTFKSASNKEEYISVIDLTDINVSPPIGKVTIPGNSETSMIRVFKTDIDNTTLYYSCNGIYNHLKIELPKKEKDAEKVRSVFTGLVSFVGGINLNGFFDSTIFQIILVFILIVLVLSFSTKYIKFVYRK